MTGMDRLNRLARAEVMPGIDLRGRSLRSLLGGRVQKRLAAVRQVRWSQAAGFCIRHGTSDFHSAAVRKQERFGGLTIAA